ncbi:TlpA disulfide reductase family protein [Cytophagaceae bacterium DM2B3-1]|uniref:TlpA disulfide reductase family protein n=1 Tax=Xanthocytophaga flava TaxID=3048013 RepID=A0ABT7CUB3_9BACT|nr:TlpA disulfide reductase family protein [Xanthocytophaga flavus]MDJ1466882.1 TlpA disulfide reductase family protein [Xanthocytophaga flavus]MDJ1496224.1 TlpA disulfide reductase family protein [Xanthocytophaga flavus]
MIRFYTWLMPLFILQGPAVHIPLYAQMLLSGTIRNVSSDTQITINIPYDNWYHTQNSISLSLKSDGTFATTLPVHKAQTFFMDIEGKRIYLYGQPNRKLFISYDAKAEEATLSFAGSLARENTCWLTLGFTFYKLFPQNWNDTLTKPEEIFSQLQQNKEKTLANLSKLTQKTSGPFQQLTRWNLTYFSISKLWDILFENGLLTTANPVAINIDSWRKVLIQAYASEPLSNSKALDAYHYQQVISYYPHYFKLKAASKQEFIQQCETLFQKPFAKTKQQMRQHGKRYLDYIVIKQTLTGKSLERAIASFLISGIQMGDLTYQAEAYEDFVNSFPKSSYRMPLNKYRKMYLESSDSTALSGVEYINKPSTLQQILELHKGRIIYVDIWGSWCTPCRQQFTFVKLLKETFKNQPVDFVYIAIEKRTQAEKKWKETIAFYKLEGQHVLADKTLTEEIKELYESGQGVVFPSYLLFDRQGRLVTTHASPPSSTTKLYQEIDTLLKTK